MSSRDREEETCPQGWEGGNMLERGVG